MKTDAICEPGGLREREALRTAVEIRKDPPVLCFVVLTSGSGQKCGMNGQRANPRDAHRCGLIDAGGGGMLMAGRL